MFDNEKPGYSPEIETAENDTPNAGFAELVPVQSVDQLWPLIAEAVAASLSRNGSYMKASEIWALCRSGQAFIVIVTTETGIQGLTIWQFDRMGDLACLLLTHVEGEPWGTWLKSARDVAIQMAVKNGSKRIVGVGAIADADVLRSLFPDLKITHQTYELELVTNVVLQ